MWKEKTQLFNQQHLKSKKEPCNLLGSRVERGRGTCELVLIHHWVIISIFVDGENKKQIPLGNRIRFHAVLVVFGSDSRIL